MTIMGSLDGGYLLVRIHEGVAAAGGSAPSSASDGIDLGDIKRQFPYEDDADVIIHAPGGSGVSIASALLVGYVQETESGKGPNAWGPLGSGPASGTGARGALNEGGVIAQVTGYPVLLVEEIYGLRSIDRLDVVLGAISGTIPSGVHVDLRLRRRKSGGH